MTVQDRIDTQPVHTPRPALVTAAAAVMTIAGAIVTLTGLLSLFARGPSAAGLEDVMHWAFVLFPPILLPLGVLDLAAARAALRGARWAPTAGLVSAALLATFGLFVLGATTGASEFLLSATWIAANGFVIHALSVTTAWFRRPGLTGQERGSTHVRSKVRAPRRAPHRPRWFRRSQSSHRARSDRYRDQ